MWANNITNIEEMAKGRLRTRISKVRGKEGWEQSIRSSDYIVIQNPRHPRILLNAKMDGPSPSLYRMYLKSEKKEKTERGVSSHD